MGLPPISFVVWSVGVCGSQLLRESGRHGHVTESLPCFYSNLMPGLSPLFKALSSHFNLTLAVSSPGLKFSP